MRRRDYIGLSVFSEVLTVGFVLLGVLRYRVLYGSAAYYIWVVTPAALLVLSHVGYLTRRWYFATAAVGAGFLVLLLREGFDLVLAAILLLLLAVFSGICFVHRKAVEREE